MMMRYSSLYLTSFWGKTYYRKGPVSIFDQSFLFYIRIQIRGSGGFVQMKVQGLIPSMTYNGMPTIICPC